MTLYNFGNLNLEKLHKILLHDININKIQKIQKIHVLRAKMSRIYKR